MQMQLSGHTTLEVLNWMQQWDRHNIHMGYLHAHVNVPGSYCPAVIQAAMGMHLALKILFCKSPLPVYKQLIHLCATLTQSSREHHMRMHATAQY